MPTYPYGEKHPKVDPTAYLAPGARVVGDVEIGPRASVWFNAVIRGDSSYVRIGADTNVQDGAALHTDLGIPCIVGDECSIGHNATVHGCTIGRGCLIGMGSVVMSGAVIGDESIVAAGALIPEGRSYPARSLLVGNPARRLRDLTDEDVERLIKPGVQNYLMFSGEYPAGGVYSST
jgi:carbonic anhydrase/acetyltransferase-like protein (isoleucine patch superfamily)